MELRHSRRDARRPRKAGDAMSADKPDAADETVVEQARRWLTINPCYATCRCIGCVMSREVVKWSATVAAAVEMERIDGSGASAHAMMSKAEDLFVAVRSALQQNRGG